MSYINIAAAITLTGWSERTFWRRFADGSVSRSEKNGPNGKAMVFLNSIVEHFNVSVGAEELEIIVAADGGNAQAQTDLALIFHSNGKFKESVWWLELAAKLEYAPAMRWLGICYAKAEGVPFNEDLSIMWLAKAASLGDQIAKAQMQGMRDRL